MTYEKRSIFADVNLAVRSGESTALVGPSGSGKSTILAILGGLQKPTSGNVHVSDPSGVVQPIRSFTAWVLQTTNAMSRRSVLENVLMGSLLDGRPNSYRLNAARSAIAQVGLTPLIHVAARKLSGGEAQRVSIARALVAERPFILADEPTGQLDASTTGQVLDGLFSERSVGLVIATHDQRVWERCQRIVDVGSLA